MNNRKEGKLMAAPENNTYWTLREKHGRPPIFETPEDLWAAAVDYFEWVEANPIMEAKLVSHQGKSKLEDLPKMRAMTIHGLCLHLGIGFSTWADYRQREDFSEVAARVESVIREQKFTGAAAGLLNPNIIARDLGLADKQEHTGPNGGPIQTTVLSDFEVARRLAFLLEQGLRAKQQNGGQLANDTGNAQRGAQQ